MRLPVISFFAFIALVVPSAAPASDAPELLATWSGFVVPYGVAADGSGHIFVTDFANSEVIEFTTDGALIRRWGHAGSGPGDLLNPTELHVANGQIYVVEYRNHRVSRFTMDGSFLGSFGSPGSGAGQFFYPVGIGSDADGNIYVAEQANNRVQKFDANGTPLLTWGTLGRAPGQMWWPFSVEVGPDGFVYVGEYLGNRIQKFTTQGAFVREWGTSGSGPGQFQVVEGMTFGRDGSLYVCDAGNNRVQHFTPDGAHLGQFPIPFMGTARPAPSDIACDEHGNLYVAAFGTGRVHMYGSPNLPPDVSHARAAEAVVWPPNHRMVPVSIVGVTDPDGDPVTLRALSITQDEPIGAVVGPRAEPRSHFDRRIAEVIDDVPAWSWSEDDATTPHCPDGTIDAAGTASVRAERLPQHGGNGRVYRIQFEASDGQAASRGIVTVCVPIHRGGRCIDDNLVIPSTGPCSPAPAQAQTDVALSADAAASSLESVEVQGSRVLVEYRLTAPAEVQLGIFDVAGRRLATIEHAEREAGLHQVEWSPTGLVSGVYFCRLGIGATTRTRTFVVR